MAKNTGKTKVAAMPMKGSKMPMKGMKKGC